MFNMMLGPLGDQFWAGSNPDGTPNALPRARFHMDRSRVAFPAGAQLDPLYAYSYNIGTNQPAAITAAIGATQADILDTTISQANTLSKTCIATHLGVSLDRVALVEPGGDVLPTLATVQVGMPRLAIRVKWAERGNEECVGTLEDYPEGIGIIPMNTAAGVTYSGQYNGLPMLSSVKPLPRPLPCKGGVTFIQVAFEPSIRDGGATHDVITSYSARIYGVGPSRALPSEAPKKAMQALAGLQRSA